MGNIDVTDMHIAYLQIHHYITPGNLLLNHKIDLIKTIHHFSDNFFIDLFSDEHEKFQSHTFAYMRVN